MITSIGRSPLSAPPSDDLSRLASPDVRVLAVDPGASRGAWCLLTGTPEDDKVGDLPFTKVDGEFRVDHARLCSVLDALRPDIFVVERVGGFPGDSPHSAFRFGFSCGLIEAAMSGRGPIVRTPPGEWKRAALIFKHAKDASRKEAAERLPHLAGQLSRKRDVDRADAALMALTVRERLLDPLSDPKIVEFAASKKEIPD